jgi:hypothetical protein
LISTTWTILGERLEPTASIINALVDILDEEEKKQQLLAAWKGFEIEVGFLLYVVCLRLSISQQRRQFPDLVPNTSGSGYAGIASGRVLNVKHSSGSRSASQSSRQVWDRVAQAASSSSTRLPPPRPTPAPQFPALPAASSRQSGQRITPWSASARGAAPVPASSSTSKASQSRAPLPKLNKELFPELPSSANARARPVVSGNTSLKNILGTGPTPNQAAWGSGNGSNTPPNVEAPADEGATTATAGGKGKKGKGKQKQTLFTLGSFPT